MPIDPPSQQPYFISDPSPDHRTLFTLAEVEAAYRTVMPEAEAVEAARDTMDGPILPHRPASFSDGLLELLSELSADAARRVRIAQGRT